MKPFWQSKTLWGIAALAISRLNGLEFQISHGGVDLFVLPIDSVLAWAGAALGVYGRLDSTEPLAVKKEPA